MMYAVSLTEVQYLSSFPLINEDNIVCILSTEEIYPLK